MPSKYCYNKGCGKTFIEAEDEKEDCVHHPGEPFFHDAYKGWSCCNKKSIDFTEFLNYKGCTVGRHNPVKPVVVSRAPVKDDDGDEEEIVQVEHKPPERCMPPEIQRPPEDTPMVCLPVKVMPSLKEALSKLQPLQTPAAATDSNLIKIGDSCKNSGCNEVFSGCEDEEGVCLHHPGYPVFHEGCKFWSCCQRKTSDFSSFLAQEGCERGKHKWKTPKNEQNQLAKCRYDHFQTASHVIVNIYAKTADPTSSTLELNPVRLNASITFSGGQLFKLDVILNGIVDVAQSAVTMAPTKIEVKLRKAEVKSWGKLGVVKPQEETLTNGKPEEDATENITQKVDVVDLSDL